MSPRTDAEFLADWAHEKQRFVYAVERLSQYGTEVEEINELVRVGIAHVANSHTTRRNRDRMQSLRG